MIDWNGLRDFRIVMETGSLTAAAAQIGVTQPTLSRRITDLETSLGTKLLLRSTRHLALTDAGERVLERAFNMEKEASTAASLATGSASSLEGTVRVSVTEGLGITWLARKLASLRRAFPRIQLELVIDNSYADLSARGADIAVRLSRPTQTGLITRKVADFRFGLYASTEYVDRNGIPQSKIDLREHYAVGLLGATETSLWLKDLFHHSNIVFRSNTLLTLRSAVRAGIGIGPVFRYLGDKDALLVPVLPHLFNFNKEIWLTCTEEMRGSARIRVVYDFLGRLLYENRQLLSGVKASAEEADL